MFGNFPPHPAVGQAVQKALEGGATLSYGFSYGYEVARAAVAEKFSTPDRPLTADVSHTTHLPHTPHHIHTCPQDIVMATGCAGALELCFSVLCESDSNVLVPSPGYSLYNCLGGALNVELKYYTLIVS